VPAGDNLIYKLTDNHWGGTGDASGTVSVTAVALPGSLDFDLMTFNVVSATLFNAPVRADTTDFTKTLGEVLAENKPPVVTLNTPNPDPGSEGSAVNFSAVATDNCDTAGQLSFFWEFSDGGIGFGPSIFHTFADDATYSYRLTVCDRAGNCTIADPNFVVDNVNPTVGAGPDKTSLWGLPVAFHANGGDAGAVDNGSLLYTWDFADPNSLIGAAGQDVSHVYSMPGVYEAVVTVHDKDGGTSSDTVMVNVPKRGTTLVYTGPVQSLPNKRVTLTASLTDSLGQPVAGAAVLFTIGSQSATGITDALGIATASIALKQKNGDHALDASFAGDAKYLASAAPTGVFKIGNK
jgi:PKD repeat protein